MVCEIHFCLHLVVLQGVWNFTHCAKLSFTQSCNCSSSWFVMLCEIFACLLHVGFLPLVFFLASLIGSAIYWQGWKRLWSAPKLRFFMYLSFNLHCHGLHKILPHSLLVSMTKKLPKTPKLAKNLLVTLARFLNVPIELKSINYYSKVFKTVNFKL